MTDVIIEGQPESGHGEGWVVEPAGGEGAGRALTAFPAEAAAGAAVTMATGAAAVDVSATTDPHHDSGSPGSGYHATAEVATGSVHDAVHDDHADGTTDDHAEADHAEADHADAAHAAESDHAAEAAATHDTPADTASAEHPAADAHPDAADSHSA